MTPKERDQLYQQATTRISVGGGTMMRGPIDGDLVLKAVEDSRKLAAVREQLRPLMPILRQMQSSGFTPHELQEINAAELLAIIDQPGGEA